MAANYRNKQTCYASAAFYRSPAWIEVRDRRLLHAGMRCEYCGRTRAEGTRLEGHHLVPVHLDISRALDFHNIRILCDVCHAFQHPHMRRRFPAANDPVFEQRPPQQFRLL